MHTATIQLPQQTAYSPISVVHMRELISTNVTDILLVPSMQELVSFQTIIARKRTMTNMTLVRVQLQIIKATVNFSCHNIAVVP
jgi:hypothetical protein